MTRSVATVGTVSEKEMMRHYTRVAIVSLITIILAIQM